MSAVDGDDHHGRFLEAREVVAVGAEGGLALGGDVAGDDRYTPLAFPLEDFHNIDCYLLVFDVTDRSVRWSAV